jgi:hypothetical protein
MPKACAVVLVAVLLSSCGGGPTAPTGAPNVAGVWNGTLDLTSEGGTTSGYLSARMFVEQHNTDLTVTGYVLYSGVRYDMAPVRGTVSATGTFTAATGGVSGVPFDPYCGDVTADSILVTFSGTNAQYAEIDSTERCGKWKFFGPLALGRDTY